MYLYYNHALINLGRIQDNLIILPHFIKAYLMSGLQNEKHTDFSEDKVYRGL